MLSKEKLFFEINSEHRLSGTHSHFTYSLDIPPEKNYDHVCLLEATIPKSYYLIPEGENTFVLREDAKEVTITLPAGNPDRRAFRATVEDLLNANSPNNWVYNVMIPKSTEFETGKFTFICTSQPDRSALIMPSHESSRIHEQFGFDAGSVNTFVANKLVSTNVSKFVVHDTVFVRSNICQNGTSNILHGIRTVSTPPFSAISHMCTEMTGYAKKLSNIGSGVYEFSITDASGKVLDLHGLPVVLQVIVYKSENVFEIIKQAIGLYNSQVEA